MLITTNVWDTLGWFVSNAVEILLFISIVVGAIQTWRSNRKGFWTKLKEVSIELINDAESMPDFKQGDGALKSKWVIEQLLKEFGGKFAFISEKKLQKIIDNILKGFNIFSNLN